MVTKQDVEQFLLEFKVKLNIFGIFFLDEREKNAQALLDLDISRLERMDIIKSIVVEDYSEGPICDVLNGFGEMWVFGKDVNEHEVYIKISLGRPNLNSICISFHVAEYKMHYPLKITNEEKL